MTELTRAEQNQKVLGTATGLFDYSREPRMEGRSNRHVSAQKMESTCSVLCAMPNCYYRSVST